MSLVIYRAKQLFKLTALMFGALLIFTAPPAYSQSAYGSGNYGACVYEDGCPASSGGSGSTTGTTSGSTASTTTSDDDATISDQPTDSASVDTDTTSTDDSSPTESPDDSETAGSSWSWKLIGSIGLMGLFLSFLFWLLFKRNKLKNDINQWPN